MSDLVEIRVAGSPEVAEQAADRLGVLFTLDRLNGPYPSRKRPELVRFYLAGRLQPAAAAAAAGAGAGDRGEWLYVALLHVRQAIAVTLRDETADRQYALEQADSSLAALIERWHASTGRAAAPTRRGADR
jgi:hypothetical protein